MNPERSGVPQFERPPVTEVIGAVQFRALPRLSLLEILKVNAALDGYELHDLQPPLPPIFEPSPGQAPALQLPQLMIGAGQQPHRGLYYSADDRFVAQLQRDRIAMNERRAGADQEAPSSTHVWPRLEVLAKIVDEGLAIEGDFGPHHPTLVELTYLNTIAPAPGVWESPADANRVLTPLSAASSRAPSGARDGVRLGLSSVVSDADGTFRGRVHVAAQSGLDAHGAPLIQLTLISRQLVATDSERLEDTFARCHEAAVEGFYAATTPEMHRIWGRTI